VLFSFRCSSELCVITFRSICTFGDLGEFLTYLILGVILDGLDDFGPKLAKFRIFLLFSDFRCFYCKIKFFQ